MMGHGKTSEQLKSMKVIELKTLIRKHNLHNAIRRYSTMKKSELVEALMKHSGGEKPAPKKKRKLEIVKETAKERADRRSKPRKPQGKPLRKGGKGKDPFE